MEALFAKQLQKINDLEQCLSFCCKKSEMVAEQLVRLQNTTIEQKNALAQANEAVLEFNSTMKPGYTKLMSEMQNQQLVMLSVMEQMDRKYADEVEKRKAATTKHTSAASSNCLMLTPVRGVDETGQVRIICKRFFKIYYEIIIILCVQPTTTPRMNLSAYAQSPFVNRIKKIQLQFVEFEVVITDTQFATIPP